MQMTKALPVLAHASPMLTTVCDAIPLENKLFASQSGPFEWSQRVLKCVGAWKPVSCCRSSSMFINYDILNCNDW